MRMLPFIASTTSDDNPFQPVLDFFESGVFKAIVRLVLILVLALYVALVLWTYKDARRRIADPVLVAVAVATAIVFPFIGVLIYTILRPPEYLDDVRERELEIRAMERRLGQDLRCPYCRSEIEPAFVVCPVCTNRLKDPCSRCSSPLEPHWRVCPYCSAATVAGGGLPEVGPAETARLAPSPAELPTQSTP